MQHETYAIYSTVEYAYAVTIIHTCSAGEKAEIIPNSFKEYITQPAKAQRKAALDKEVASLTKKNDVHTVVPVTSVAMRHKRIGNRHL